MTESKIERNSNLAILWIEKKIEKLGGVLKDKQNFEKRLRIYIDDCIKCLGTTAVLSTVPDLVNKGNHSPLAKDPDETLAHIFATHNVWHGCLSTYVFSMLISNKNVIVADGHGAPKKRIIGYDPISENFKYTSCWK